MTEAARQPQLPGAPLIYKAISNVIRDVGSVAKDKVNKQQGFKFRSIDDVYNALHPALAKNRVFIVPTILEQTREKKVTKQGTEMILTMCRIKFTFYAEDGSHIETVIIGEGLDTGDKGTNKCMAIAYKYACFQVFCIPTEEMVDPDAERPEMADNEPPARLQPSTGKTAASKQRTVAKEAAAKGAEKPQGAQSAGGAAKTQPVVKDRNAASKQQEPSIPSEAEISKDPDQELVDENMIRAIRAELERTGVNESQILKLFNVSELKNLTLSHFQKVMKKFEKTPDRRKEETA